MVSTECGTKLSWRKLLVGLKAVSWNKIEENTIKILIKKNQG